MQVSNQTKAVLLLTSHFTRPENGKPKPLSTTEWARFALWLRDHDLQPASLLTDDPRGLLSGWVDRRITQDRIGYLLRRGGALGFALEKWERAGLWLLTRSDREYPSRLKLRLKLDSPPILFGCGSKMLLNEGGVAVVGSRNASDSDLAFAAQIGAEAAAQGHSVVSGGARGVDESAMLGALASEGTAVGVLADGLLRSATSAKYRKHLMSNDLALVSPFNPDAGFNVGNAMARNRYIYCLSDSALVVSSSRDKGGTWHGAIENLKASWVPLWVKPSRDVNSGTHDLVKRGGRWLPNDGTSLEMLFEIGERATETRSKPETLPWNPLQRGAEVPPRSVGDGRPQPVHHVSPRLTEVSEGATAPLDDISFYDLFLHRAARLIFDQALKADEIAKCLDIAKGQVNAWLKQATAEGRIKKLGKPVRYRWENSEVRQASMFDDS